jgi:type IV pilus assembly protein PilP
MNRPTRLLITTLATATTLLVAGCSDGLGDLRAKIEEQKTKPGGRIKPLPEVKPYESYAYTASELRSPFYASLVGEGDEQAGPRPDASRPREYLEQFSLDTLRMVGTLRLGRSNYGLVQTKDGLVHRVLPGNRLGQNDGTVLSITESKITLVELVPDGLGGYIERPAALALSD